MTLPSSHAPGMSQDEPTDRAGAFFFLIFFVVPCWLGWIDFMRPWTLLAALALTLFALTLWRVRGIRGVAIVRAAGARRLRGKERNALELRLLGVVDELAVAARLPTPAVFVIDEPAINALSTCRRPADAAIAVTSGALEQLSRAELQAMVAHELAHIVRGDARLDAKSAGLRLALFELGGIIAPPDEALSRRSAWKTDEVDGHMSMQRDLDADAAAVALLCDPGSLASCLRKVAADPERGRMRSMSSRALRRLWFADATRTSHDGGLACPLEARMRALERYGDVAPLTPRG